MLLVWITYQLGQQGVKPFWDGIRRVADGHLTVDENNFSDAFGRHQIVLNGLHDESAQYDHSMRRRSTHEMRHINLWE